MTKVIDTLKNMNRDGKNIFSILQKNGPLTKAQIMDLTKLKLTTLNRIIKPIIDEKLIVEASIGESTGGRRPSLYDVNMTDYAFIGIDISRIYTQVIFADFKLNIIHKERFSMDSSYSPEKTVDRITDICKNAIHMAELMNKELIAVGLGTVGPMDIYKGIMKSPANFMSKGWTGTPIKEMLQKNLNLEVYMDNGANAAVTVEYLFGYGKNLKNIAYFNFGIGIRTGAISDGNIVRTINDAEDAFAHMVIDVDGEKCICGNYGCVECYSSIKSITKNFKKRIAMGESTKIQKSIDDINYIDISLAAQNGDNVSEEVIKKAAEIFGTGLSNFINLLNPELIILSGPLIMVSELFYKISVATAKQKCYLSKHSNIFFNRGGYFKENAISAGAAAMAIENLLRE
ncbi:ROK family transcriptional regulator [Clostridium pasteurianum]|uniref:Transcriptional regulator/sugar kinase n=1 Tax=Clostridium pasteurianum BC1 TaxID=86416 RepID=R4KBK6_CLOPA|nr:ROK family transcriptional regulator [Clostridium pasteurianum]AGK99071.1 transcriptional regulator/sugar kinase [Clostridium pasteurianum BC1]